MTRAKLPRNGLENVTFTGDCVVKHSLQSQVSFADEKAGGAGKNGSSGEQRGTVPSYTRVSLRIVPTNAALPPASASPFPDAAVIPYT
jgi:hypothetical protein